MGDYEKEQEGCGMSFYPRKKTTTEIFPSIKVSFNQEIVHIQMLIWILFIKKEEIINMKLMHPPWATNHTIGLRRIEQGRYY